ncbi:hypothetical protein A7P95_10330 [Eikenella longinqua]|uniref:Knr4/Smi1-like domain-containing protein n=2 Tax=Eikenella TaxID=538 RepID=A0A1A9RTI1_9NEIS|nr:hypothetical protein A7P95_10330 [Eikenella longinqua]
MPHTFLTQLEARIRAQYAKQDGLADELLSGTPVTKAEIAAAEQQLGTAFPPPYRALLLHFGTGCDLGIEIDSLPQVV